ncbi:Arabinogalactan protein 20-like protein [Drosera capensis]
MKTKSAMIGTLAMMMMMIMTALLFAVAALPCAHAQPSPAPAPAPAANDGTSIDQGIAYVLLLVALALTYLIHSMDNSPFY